MMDSPFILAKWALRIGAVAFFGVDGIMVEAAAESVATFAKDLWEKHMAKCTPEERCRIIEELAQAEVFDVMAEVRDELDAIPDLATRRAAEAYVAALPGQLRASLRRAADPSGRTVSAAQVPQDAADLQHLLPSRLPRFRKGDRPGGIGDWELEELLGTGGFGEVWKARNPHMSTKTAALKFCLDAKAASSLRREAALLNRVGDLAGQQAGGGIVKILGTALGAEPPCIIYEFVEGGTLAGLIHERKSFQAEEAARLILELAETMSVCHSLPHPIVHRDLKPANILVEARTGRLRITDFGIGGIGAPQAGGSHVDQLSQASASGSHTPLYASPQQIRGCPADVRDDVYALGIVWWQLICGDMGHGAPSGRWMQKLTAAGHPAGLVELLADCLEAEAGQRLANGGSLAAGLRYVLQGGGPVVDAPGDQPTPPRKKAESHQPLGKDPRLDTVKEILAAMVPIKPGSVMCKTGWFSKKELRVDQRYSICQFPVTQKWYEAVVGTNPSHFKEPQRPVESVSWHDAVAFCKKINEVAAGLTGRMRFALPSEAQWEFACRGGSTGEFGLLKSGKEGTVDQMAWYGENSGNQTHPVGQKEGNAFGLYDMHGNVWEWCEDKDGEGRVVRGGSWGIAAERCRAAYRHGRDPGYWRSNLGFRPVLTTQNK